MMANIALLLTTTTTVALLAVEIATDLTEWRVRFRIAANDVLEAAEKSVGFEDFQGLLSEELAAASDRGDDCSYRARGTGESFKMARAKLERLSAVFMEASHEYVARLLFEYCDLALWMVEKKNYETFYSEMDVHELIGFADDRDYYCVLTALHDSRADVRRPVASVLFFQTVESDDERYLFDRLVKLCPRFDDVPAQTNSETVDEADQLSESSSLSSSLSPTIDCKQIESRLNETKQTIADFSGIFCSAWGDPFLSHRLVAAFPLDGVSYENFFVHHVLYTEKCVVKFEQLSEESRQYRISSWNCDNILKSQEYRFQKYEEDVWAPVVTKQKLIDKIKTSVKKSFCHHRDETIAQGPSEYYSLATLKYKLKTNDYYLNVVKYYNVASAAVLMASIKEGNKIFKGIKHAVGQCCDEKMYRKNEGKFAWEMRGLRSTLSVFKAHFDRLVWVVLLKKRIRLADVRQKDTFDVQVNALMTSLDFEDGQMRRICRVILGKLLKDADYDVHVGAKPNRIKLERYYFTEPLHNVSQLYRFVADNF